MRHLRFVAVLIVAGTALAACDEGPTGPSPPGSPPMTQPHFAAGTVFTFTSGETGAPVPGAVVRLGGTSFEGPFDQTYLTDDTGQVALDRAVLHTPAPELDVASDGFLFRETFARSGNETSFTLWPRTSPTGLDEAFTETLVYSFAACPTQTTGSRALQRLDPSTSRVLIALDPELQTPEDEAKHLDAIARMNAALGGSVEYALSTEDNPTGVVFEATLANGVGCNPGRAAFVSLRFDGPGLTISSGTIFYCIRDYSSRTVLHELGHTYGFQHSPSPADVMYCAGGNTTFSPREELAMRLLLLRPGRNTWPDSDRDFVPPMSETGFGFSRTETIGCNVR